MNRNALFTAAIVGLTLAGCESGDINIAPSTNVQDSNNTINDSGGGTGPNPCATITIGGAPTQGTTPESRVNSAMLS